jgi:malate dehydrogenase
MSSKKVSIIGAGRVGSTLAQILALKGVCDVVLWDRKEEHAKGIALDIKESAPVEKFDISITGTGNLRDLKNSDVVVLTAGVQRKAGQSRDDLLISNAEIIKPLCEGIARYAPDCKLIVLTNPLDGMVYMAKKVTKFQKNRVIGMAGILDAARFEEFIAMELGIGADDVFAVVLGSHGDFMVPLPRYSSVAGIPLVELLPKQKIDKIIKRTRNAGAEIIELESSSAFYAPAASLSLMVISILEDRRRIFPCSAYLDGEYGVHGIFMGVPVILGKRGIEKIIELKLNRKERDMVNKSAGMIKRSIKPLLYKV